MVESLKELNRICQKPNYRKAGNWLARYFVRDAALPITWALLHTPVTANQVTLASLFVALFGMILYSFPNPAFFCLSALLLQFWYILDHVDGQIARYRKTASLSGRFFDFVMHHIVHGSLLFAMSFYCYSQTGSIFYLLWGFAASLSILTFNMTHDIKYKTFFEQFMKHPDSFQVRPVFETGSKMNLSPKLDLKTIFSLIHKLCEIHILISVLTIASLVQFFIPLDFRTFLFTFYGSAVILIAVVKLTYVIHNQKIDEEFESTFSKR